MLSAEVVDYDLQGEAEHYENHVYTLQVWIEQDFYFTQRSYVAFCDFHSKLVRQYPRTSFPNFPLSPIVGSSNHKNSKSKSTSLVFPLNSNQHNITKSISTNETRRKSFKPDGAENAAQKKISLTYYLKELLQVPEILSSDALLTFLDEETAINGLSTQDLTQEDYDQLPLHFLLKSEDMLSKTVRKDYSFTLPVKKDEIFVYYFSTKHHDIGFSIKCNDEICVSYQRHNSHEKSVVGFTCAPNDGVLEVIWDNSYSKLRTKKLYYTTKLLTNESFQAAKDHANEYKQNKMTYFKRRMQLKKLLTKLSSEMISSRRTPSEKATNITHKIHTDNEAIDEGSFKYITDEQDKNSTAAWNKLVDECNEMKEKNRFLQVALAEAETSIVVERNARAQVVQANDDLLQQKDQLEEEINEMRLELESLRNDYYELQQNTQSKVESTEKEGLTLEEILNLSEITNSNSNLQILLNFTRDLMQQREKNIIEINQLEQATTKLKADKKQLRAYALQLKDKSEHDEARITTLEHEMDLVRVENQNLKDTISSLEKLIEKYQTHIEQDIETISQRSSSAQPNEDSSDTSNEKITTNEEKSSDEFFPEPSKPTNPVRRILERLLLNENDDEDDENNIVDEKVNSPNLHEQQPIVVDLAENDPDDMSAILDDVASSFMGMMSSFDRMMSSSKSTSTSVAEQPQQQSSSKSNFSFPSISFNFS